ncbi:MAG: nucleotidyltransferase domain-containing protein, partial [Anaerolineae bacterium]|nr:nucleotidyltransferase domain-containing protein [Anaerolineae bacterium]
MTYPTPYPDANAVLDRLLSGVREILGERLIGMYLYGSLATGDFDPATSDVDFVVVTDMSLDDTLFAQIDALHRRVAASDLKLAHKLEGAYTSPQTLRRFDPAEPPSFYYNEDHEDKLSIGPL